MICIVVGIIFIAFGIFCYWLASDDSDVCLAVAGTLVIIVGVVITGGNVAANSIRNELINTPVVIEQMKQEVKTAEEKEMINDKIRDYNETIADYHKDLLGKTNRSKQEQKIFELQAIEPIQ